MSADKSFSYELKCELSRSINQARHCRIAELAGIISHLGNIRTYPEGRCIILNAEHELPLITAASLVKVLFNIKCDPEESDQLTGMQKYELMLPTGPESEKVLETLKFGEGWISFLTQKNCCKQSFLRGLFIAAGTVADPEKSYQLDFVCKSGIEAQNVSALLKSLGFDPKLNIRREYHVVYIKESEAISELLGLMGARVSLLKLENARIVKEVRGNVNRRVNCETANIKKTAAASAKLLEDIELIKSTIGLESLTNGLDEIARLRLEYPTSTLQELGEMLDPPLGKSGVNHRLRKISSIAETLK